jgi:Super-infection exclusion protein B
MLAWSDVFKWLGNFTPRYAVVIAAISGLLLFTPERKLKYFDLDGFAHAHRNVIALVFGAMIVLLVSYPLSSIWKWLGNKVIDYRVYRAIRKSLYNLGSDQTALLLRYAESGRNTILVPFNQTAVAEDLLQKGILYRPAQIGNAMDGVGYSVTREAAPFLRYKAFQKIVLKSVKRQL